MTTEKLPDLDSREHIEKFVELFYQRLLADEQLAPVFIDVAQIDLSEHLPRISDYWCKMLLGDPLYRRHTMNIHRQLHGKRALTPADFQRWLSCFTDTLDAHFSGPGAERARQLAMAIAANMQKTLPAHRPD